MAGTSPQPTSDPTVPGRAPEAAPAYRWLGAYPPAVDWQQSFTAVPLHTLLEEALTKHGDRVCTHFLGKTTTFAEIGRQVRHAAAGLQKLGVGKGSKVGLFLPNSPTYIVWYYAILAAGGTVVNYNPLYTVEELTFQVKDSETEIMVTLDLAVLFGKVEALMRAGTLQRAVVASFPALLPAAKSLLFRLLRGKELSRWSASPVAGRILGEASLLANDGNFTRHPIDPHEDVAVIQYTGGTTGTPKGAMLTHANCSINTQQGAAWSKATLEEGKERIMAILPFFHVFAMTAVMNNSIKHGSTLILMPRFVLDDALKLIHQTKPTVMPGVPTLFNAILNHPKLASFDLSSLKLCLSGGAPLPLEVKERFEALTGCRIVEGYGLSETSPSVTCTPLVGPGKPGSIGQPLPGTIVSLRDLADPGVEVPLGDKGEICIKGPQVMKGYWKRPKETAEQMTPDGYLRTGDVGVMDEEGFITIVDRIKDLILSSGYNVYPRRVEEAIYEHPAVEEVTVIGVPDAQRGEAPKAFVKLKAGTTATAEDIFRHLEPKISRIEMPAAIEFRDALPKTMVGKLSKKELVAEEKAKRAKV
jgi:long-chain acyl-CoA synthetase